MANLIDSIKDLVSADTIRKVSKIVEEEPQNVNTAVQTIIPGLLAMYLKKHSPQTNNILTEAGNLNILGDTDKISEEKLPEAQKKVSDDFLQNVLGDKAADFSDAIAKKAGISKVATNRLVSMISPYVVGFMGQRLVKDGSQVSELISEVAELKPRLAEILPEGMADAMGLSYIFNSPAGAPKKQSWILWVAIIVVVVAVLAWILLK